MKSARISFGNFLLKAWDKVPAYMKTRPYWLWSLGELVLYVIGIFVLRTGLLLAGRDEWFEQSSLWIQIPALLVVFVLASNLWTRIAPRFGLTKTW